MTRILRVLPTAVRCVVAMVLVEVLIRSDLPSLARRMGVPLQLDGTDTVYRPGNVTVLDDADLRALRVFQRLDRFWWSSTCLRRALVAGHLLRAHGPRLVIGVRKPPGRPLTAHAWLRVDGAALDEAALDYAPLADGPAR